MRHWRQCSDTDACNYADPANEACATPVDCDTCSDATGTGIITDNDADNDGVCDADEVVGCQDNTACNYNAAATDAGACTFTDGICESCSGETDGTGTVVDNDADDDGVCDADEVVGCQDNTACNYNSAATDAGACTYTSDPCDTCSGATDGTGTVVENDSDSDGVCDADEVVGCTDSNACNYNAAATDAGARTYTDGICETCVAGAIVDNDADNDGVCDDNEITGCTDSNACNYDSDPTTDTDNTLCTYTVDPCDTCSGETDGTGTVVDNDADNDGVCDDNEMTGCTDSSACNYDSDPTTDTDNTLCAYTVDLCDTCSGETDGTGTVVDNDADNDGVCDDNEITGCTDSNACNYDSDPTTDTDNTLCTYTVDLCDTCSGETDGTGTVVDNDADNDGVCDADEVDGCTDPSGCNTCRPELGCRRVLCVYATGCETCSARPTAPVQCSQMMMTRMASAMMTKSQGARTTQRVTTTQQLPTLTEAVPMPPPLARLVPVQRTAPVQCSQMMMTPMASAMMTKSQGARTPQRATTTLQQPTLTEAVPTPPPLVNTLRCNGRFRHGRRK